MAENVEHPEELDYDYLSNHLYRGFEQRAEVNRNIVEVVTSYYSTLPKIPKPDLVQTLDLGAGIGDLSEMLYDIHLFEKGKHRVIAVEDAPTMLCVLDNRYEDKGTVTVHENNLTERGCLEPHRLVVPAQSNVIVSCFLTSFIGQPNVQNLFQEVYDNLLKGGMFVVVDEMPTMLNNMNNILRYANIDLSQVYNEPLGYKGVYVKLPIEMYLQTLKAVGFNQIEMFYKNGTIAGLICLK